MFGGYRRGSNISGKNSITRKIYPKLYDGCRISPQSIFIEDDAICWVAASLGDTVTLLGDLLWPPTQVAAANILATATWRPESLCWV